MKKKILILLLVVLALTFAAQIFMSPTVNATYRCAPPCYWAGGGAGGGWVCRCKNEN